MLDTTLLYYPQGLAAQRLLVLGAGKKDKFGTAELRRLAGAAVRMLKRAGYHPTQVCGRRSVGETLRHSKPRCRARFIDEGYTIIANVGNNRTDFSGPKDYGRAFKLPNYGGRLG